MFGDQDRLRGTQRWLVNRSSQAQIQQDVQICSMPFIDSLLRQLGVKLGNRLCRLSEIERLERPRLDSPSRVRIPDSILNQSSRPFYV